MRRLPVPSLPSFDTLSRRAVPSLRRLPKWPLRDHRFASAAPTTLSSTPPSLEADYRLSQLEGTPLVHPNLPFRFETGLGLFAKRSPRPFPPPFLSPPSGSFTDPLSTHNRSRDRRAFVNGELIQGTTNGDDAVLASDYFVGANDGVGAWATRPRGHAGLWARLILHFWATAIHEDATQRRGLDEEYVPDPLRYLQAAYDRTLEATSPPNDWQGTTTATGAQLHYKMQESGTNGERNADTDVTPMLYITNLGDSQVMVVRPSAKDMVFKTKEQWHWFDCPRQLGTNSPDSPRDNAVVTELPIREGDIVLAMTDGVIDNLWAHEIVENVIGSVKRWEEGEGGDSHDKSDRTGGLNGGMVFVAEELMVAAKTIALDPFAESPFMEHAIDEGLPSEGGKLDDISVVAALCTRNRSWSG